jgi:hypothetical protein
MKMYVGVTDYDWFTILKESKCDKVNFWRPGSSTFKVLEPNDNFDLIYVNIKSSFLLIQKKNRLQFIGSFYYI